MTAPTPIVITLGRGCLVALTAVSLLAVAGCADGAAPAPTSYQPPIELTEPVRDFLQAVPCDEAALFVRDIYSPFEMAGASCNYSGADFSHLRVFESHDALLHSLAFLSGMATADSVLFVGERSLVILAPSLDLAPLGQFSWVGVQTSVEEAAASQAPPVSPEFEREEFCLRAGASLTLDWLRFGERQDELMTDAEGQFPGLSGAIEAVVADFRSSASSPPTSDFLALQSWLSERGTPIRELCRTA